MTTLKALNIEIVNILDKITEQWSHMTPIDQLIILKNKLNKLTIINIIVNLITCIFIIAGVIRHWNN